VPKRNALQRLNRQLKANKEVENVYVSNEESIPASNDGHETATTLADTGGVAKSECTKKAEYSTTENSESLDSEGITRQDGSVAMTWLPYVMKRYNSSVYNKLSPV
jgi:hypothetical protein